MASMTYSTEFDAQPETVFRVMDDIDQAKKWLGGLIEIEALTEGGNRVGAKTRHVYDENGLQGYTAAWYVAQKAGKPPEHAP